MFSRIAIICIFALEGALLHNLSPEACGAAQESPGAIERLRDLDAIAMSRFTLQFEIEAPESYILFDHGRARRLCTVTQKEGLRAVECQTVAYPPVVFTAKGTGGYEDCDYDDDGHLIVWRLASRYSLLDSSTNESHWVFSGIVVNSTGSVVHEMTYTMRSAFRLDDHHDWYEVDRWCWAAGLGFSPELEGVEEQTRDAKGIIYLRAKGKYGRSQLGTWELTLDPDQRTLVRSAKFRGDLDKKLSISVTTSGVMRFGDLVIPEEGRFEYPAIPDRNESILRFRECRSNSDETLIARIREVLNRARASGDVELMEYRVDPNHPTRTRNVPVDRD